MSSRSEDPFRFVVVGGGSAGCTLAYRLSQLTGARILLLESGRRGNPLLTRMPVGALWTVNNPHYDWRYDMDPDSSRDGRVQRCHSGRVLGGGSSINGMIHARGPAADFDAWEAAGARGWAYADVLPHFCRAETRRNGDPAFRGSSGPLSIEEPRSIHETTHRFLTAAQEIGLAITGDYNGRHAEGAASRS